MGTNARSLTLQQLVDSKALIGMTMLVPDIRHGMCGRITSYTYDKVKLSISFPWLIRPTQISAGRITHWDVMDAKPSVRLCGYNATTSVWVRPNGTYVISPVGPIIDVLPHGRITIPTQSIAHCEQLPINLDRSMLVL